MKKLFLAIVLLSGIGINSLWAQEIPMQIIKEGPATA